MSFFDPFDMVDKASSALGMGKKPNPAKAAMSYLDQVPGAVKPYYDPYINAGNKALPGLMDQFQSLISDPTAVMKSIGNTFQESPGYQFRKNQGLTAIEQAAASGGMAGSQQHQQQAGQLAENLAAEDYYPWIQSGMQNYFQGVNGMQNINQMGFNASTDFGQTLANLMGSKAQLAYEGQNAKNKSQGGLGNLISLGAQVAPMFL